MTDKYKVLFAGVLGLIVTVGVARFAYTPLLPVMQAQTWLDDQYGGWLAAVNYMGYMTGALLAASISQLATKDRLYRVYLLLAVVTTGLMGLTDNVWAWVVLRFLSGLSSSGGMLLASALILNWLIRHHHPGELGIHFLGIGSGIVFAAVVVEVLVRLAVSWDWQWQVFALLAAALAVPAWVWMPKPDASGVTAQGKALVDLPPSPTFYWLMLLAYFCAGYGYVISATFIVDIIESSAGLKGFGQLVFLLVGVAAMPAAIFWDRLARRVGYLNALFWACGIQVLGIILPALTTSLTGAVLSALLYGGTFVGCVSLVLTMAGRFYPTKPARLMGKMTLSYGAAQIVAPALTGVLAQQQGSYELGLYLAAAVVALGALLVIVLKYVARPEPALENIRT